MTSINREPLLLENGTRARTKLNPDWDWVVGAFNLPNPQGDRTLTEAEFLNPNTQLADTCLGSLVAGRLRASGYYTLNDPEVDLKQAKWLIRGVWKYRNGAMFKDVENHPIVQSTMVVETPIVCQQRSYEPTNEAGVCGACKVRVSLAEKGKDCLYASKFFPRKSA
jgi:hypothetical protein